MYLKGASINPETPFSLTYYAAFCIRPALVIAYLTVFPRSVAITILTISNPINGYTHTVSAYVTEHFIRYTNHTVPNAYATAVPTPHPSIVRKYFCVKAQSQLLQ